MDEFETIYQTILDAHLRGESSVAIPLHGSITNVILRAFRIDLEPVLRWDGWCVVARKAILPYGPLPPHLML